MAYCVIKNTAIEIDGSKNPIEIMLQNAQNSGFTETEVEIITTEEYGIRKALEPKPIKEPTTEIELLKIKLQKAEELATENSLNQQLLLELLIELGVL